MWLLKSNIYLVIRSTKNTMARPSCNFRHQGELLINGGRIFDIDGSRKILLMARRLSGAGGTFVLTQMSLHTGEIDDILLPPTTRAIKDLHPITGLQYSVLSGKNSLL